MDYGLLVMDFGLGTRDYGLGIAVVDYRLWIRDNGVNIRDLRYFTFKCSIFLKLWRSLFSTQESLNKHMTTVHDELAIKLVLTKNQA